MDIEAKVKEVLQSVLDVKPDDVKPDATLEDAFGVDSTEMVEINVGIKKALGLDMTNNELKKTQSLNEIIEVLKSKEAKGAGV